MKTNEQLQAEIDELKLKIAKLEFDHATQPNADWEPSHDILRINTAPAVTWC